MALERTTRSTRARISTQIYTSSKTQPVYQNYVLNEKRAVQKLADSTLRTDNISVHFKHGNVILELSAGAFLIFIDSLDEHFRHKTNLSVSPTTKYDKSKTKLVERSVSVALAAKPKQQLYRVNIYHTTCRIEVNGQQVSMFINELKEIGEIMKHKPNMAQLNDLIREKCQEFLDLKANENRVIIQPINYTAESVNVNKQDQNKCPKCKKQCQTRSVWCTAGLHWIHYTCDKLKKNAVDALESNQEDATYTCSLCSEKTQNSLPQATKASDKGEQNISVTIVDSGSTEQQRDLTKIAQKHSTESQIMTSDKVNTRAISILEEEIDQRGDETMVKTSRKQSQSQLQIVATPSQTSVKSGQPTLPTVQVDLMAKGPSGNKQPESTESNLTIRNKDLRQKEQKLRKKEEDLRREKSEIEDCSKDNTRLKSYSLKLEAQVRELENSNRLLRMKVVGMEDQIKTNSQNQQYNNMHNSRNSGTNTCDIAANTEMMGTRRVSHNNDALRDLSDTLEWGMIKDRISHLEETSLLYRRMRDMEITAIHQRINNMERSMNIGANIYPHTITQPHQMLYPAMVGASYIRPPPPNYYATPMQHQNPYNVYPINLAGQHCPLEQGAYRNRGTSSNPVNQVTQPYTSARNAQANETLATQGNNALNHEPRVNVVHVLNRDEQTMQSMANAATGCPLIYQNKLRCEPQNKLVYSQDRNKQYDADRISTLKQTSSPIVKKMDDHLHTVNIDAPERLDNPLPQVTCKEDMSMVDNQDVNPILDFNISNNSGDRNEEYIEIDDDICDTGSVGSQRDLTGGNLAETDQESAEQHFLWKGKPPDKQL